ncbi:hypothetical protein ES703_53242 [subsurface metagenome]
MKAAQEGRPFCRKAGRYLLPVDWGNSNISSQCRECSYILYIGCPGFEGSTKIDQSVLNYIQWRLGEKEIDWRIGLKCLDCEKPLTEEDITANKCMECGSDLQEPRG